MYMMKSNIVPASSTDGHWIASFWHRLCIGHGLYFVSLASVMHRSRSVIRQFGIGLASVTVFTSSVIWRHRFCFGLSSVLALVMVSITERQHGGQGSDRQTTAEGQLCSHVSNMYVNTNRWSMYVFNASHSVLYNSHPSSCILYISRCRCLFGLKGGAL